MLMVRLKDVVVIAVVGLEFGADDFFEQDFCVCPFPSRDAMTKPLLVASRLWVLHSCHARCSIHGSLQQKSSIRKAPF